MGEKKQKRVAAGAKLTDKEKIFCEEYIFSRNALKSYMTAYGATKATASSQAYRKLKQAKIRDYIDKAINERCNDLKIRSDDIVSQHARIAFAKVSDFIKTKRERSGRLSYELDIENTDTSVISELQVNTTGFKIKFADRQKSLEFLAEHLDMSSEGDIRNVIMIPEANSGE